MTGTLDFELLSEREQAEIVGGNFLVPLLLLVVAECVHYSKEFIQGIRDGWNAA